MGKRQTEAYLFDLGNVLLFFSHEKMVAQVATVTGLTPTAVLGLLTKDRWQWRYEAGQVSTDELVDLFAAAALKPFTRPELLNAASDIFVPNDAMLPLLKKLKASGAKLVMVSNTNEAHMDFARPRFELFSYFDTLIFSYEVKSMKPEGGFYEAALKAAACPKEACLFIDDMPENVEGARRFGFRAVQFTGADHLSSYLDSPI